MTEPCERCGLLNGHRYPCTDDQPLRQDPLKILALDPIGPVMPEPVRRCREAIKAAWLADDAYAAAIKAAGLRSRWDVDAKKYPAVAAARLAMIQAAEIEHQAWEAYREWKNGLSERLSDITKQAPMPWPPGQAEKPKPDRRMVQCVIDGYTDCPSRSPEACICGELPPEEYERRYVAKYGRATD